MIKSHHRNLGQIRNGKFYNYLFLMNAKNNTNVNVECCNTNMQHLYTTFTLTLQLLTDFLVDLIVDLIIQSLSEDNLIIC